MDTKKRWESICRTKPTSEVSWFQPEGKKSLELIRRVAPERAAPILDVGGGASVLVADLLTAGYTDVTVLDLASSACEGIPRTPTNQSPHRVTDAPDGLG